VVLSRDTGTGVSITVSSRPAGVMRTPLSSACQLTSFTFISLGSSSLAVVLLLLLSNVAVCSAGDSSSDDNAEVSDVHHVAER